MIIVRHQRYTHRAPENWQECTPELWAALVPFSRLNQVPDEPIQQLACQFWAGITDKEWQRWRLMAHEWEALKAQFGWVFEKPRGKPFEVLEWQRLKLLLPDDNFENSKAIDVAMGFIHYTDFTKDTADPHALDLLVATLCRPIRSDLKKWQRSPDYDGDLREPYNDVRVEARAKQLATLPLPMKVVILDYWERMALAFLELYGEMFGKSDREARYQDGRGWLMMLKNIAREGQFGDFDTVCKQPVHLVFAAALDDCITMKEMEQNQKNESNDFD